MTLILKQSTSIDIRVGPFVDATDAVTPETGITLAGADQAEVLKANGAATAAMAGAFVAVTGADGWYDYTVATGDVDTVGEAVFVVQDLSVALPVFVRAYVVEEAVYDAMYGASAAGPNIGKTGYSLDATGLDAISSTALGMVEIAKAIWDRVLSGATHNIVNSAGRIVRFLREAGNYSGSAIYLNTNTGAAGTTDFENGTDSNPSLTIADVNTLAASRGISTVIVAPGSSVTFPGAQTDEVWEGRDWALALGGRDITGSFIFGASVTGIGTATGTYEFEECDIGAVTLDNDGHFELCALTATFTVGQAGTYTFHQCFTESAAAITIDFAALGATAVHLLSFDGEINFKNMAAGDSVHITGGGDITTETCTGGMIDHDGFFEYTDAGGNVTENRADIEVAVDAILPETNTALSDIPFLMVLSSDHVSPATGLTVTATRSIDGGTTFAATTGTVTEAANGAYHFDASAADMNGAIVTFKFSAATADDTFISIRTGG